VVKPISFYPTTWYYGGGHVWYPKGLGVALYPVDTWNPFGPYGDIPGGNNETTLPNPDGPPNAPRERLEGTIGFGTGRYY
jgi:hypothetical protein